MAIGGEQLFPFSLRRFLMHFIPRLPRVIGLGLLPVLHSAGDGRRVQRCSMLTRNAVIWLFFALVLAIPVALPAQHREVGGGQMIVGTGDTNSGYSNTSGIGFNGTFFLYVQGDDSFGDQTHLDSIFKYEKPISWEGLTSPYIDNPDSARIKGDSSCYYGGPNVFTDAGQLFMTNGESPTPPPGLHNKFQKILLGRSSYGRLWSWTPLFTTAPSFDIPAVSLRYASIAGDNPKLHWIDGGWQVWVQTNNSHYPCDVRLGGCLGAGTYANESGFAYFSADTNYNLGAAVTPSSAIRCLPANYSNSRMAPERIEGTPLLYSTSNDLNCIEDGHGSYIVVTSLEQ